MAENDPSKLAQLIEYSEKYQDDQYEYRCVRLGGSGVLRVPPRSCLRTRRFARAGPRSA